MKYFISIYFFILLTSSSIFSQSNPYYFCSDKVILFDFSDLNYKTDDNFPRLDNYVIMFSAGKHFIGDKGAYGLNISYLFNKKSKNGSQTLFKGYGISSIIEYNLFYINKIRMFSLIEPGFNMYKITLADDKIGGVSFYDIFNKKITNYSFSNTGFFVDIGFGVKYLFDIWDYKFGLGVTSGYKFSIDNNWKYDNVHVVSDKLAKLNGFFVGFNININLVKKSIKQD